MKVKYILAGPLRINTLHKEYIEPLTAAGQYLGKAIYLAATDPQRLARAGIRNIDNLVTTASTDPEAFMAMGLSMLVDPNIKNFRKLLIVPFIVRLFVRRHYDTSAVPTTSSQKKSTGALEGLRLLLSKPYLMGILVVGTVYEIIGEILNLQMKLMAHSAYPSPEKLAGFMGQFGVAVNVLSLFFAFVGTSFFIRRFGITFCLVMYPVTIAAAIMFAWSFNGLWFFFAAMVALKGLSYAFNNPCKEIMYIPTSKDIKFKAKSWMDGFGGRSAKALGASVIAAFQVVAPFISLISYGSLVSLSIITMWIPIAFLVGRTNSKLVQDGKIIE